MYANFVNYITRITEVYKLTNIEAHAELDKTN